MSASGITFEETNGRQLLDRLVVVTHPEPIELEARQIEHEATPEGGIALGYYHRGAILARGVVSAEALDAITGLLRNPVSLALAATEDEDRNIDARVCLVLPIDATELAREEDEDDADAPWKSSVPAPPFEVESSYREERDDQKPRIALLPIGNVVRTARNRHYEDVVSDAREMLENLLAGRGHDAVSRAIDDLLDSI
jgi:hypothetical protein